MKTIEEQGDYAFACAAENGHQGGMTLRDWFAGMALQGLSVGCSGMLVNDFSAYAKGSCNSVLAERAYVLADTMLEARKK